MNYNIGDKVKYGALGECVIVDKRTQDWRGGNKLVYVLNTADDDKTVIYVPEDKASSFKQVKPALSKNEIGLLYFIDAIEVDANLDDKKRNAIYFEVIDRADIREIVAYLKGIYAMQESLKHNRRKLKNIEVNAMRIYERMIFDELSRTMALRSQDIQTIVLHGFNAMA
jgi:RNA polymerase-interacting CarD/CdnL/TRCF family regulator